LEDESRVVGIFKASLWHTPHSVIHAYLS
jgi:hypothetical protein